MSAAFKKWLILGFAQCLMGIAYTLLIGTVTRNAWITGPVGIVVGCLFFGWTSRKYKQYEEKTNRSNQ